MNENSSKSVPSAELIKVPAPEQSNSEKREETAESTTAVKESETKTSESAQSTTAVKENKDGDAPKSTTSEMKNPQNVRDVTEPVKSTETVAPTISKTESNSASASAATTTTTTTTTTTATPHHSSPGNAGAPIQMSLFAILPAIIVLVHQFY